MLLWLAAVLRTVALHHPPYSLVSSHIHQTLVSGGVRSTPRVVIWGPGTRRLRAPSSSAMVWGTHLPDTCVLWCDAWRGGLHLWSCPGSERGPRRRWALGRLRKPVCAGPVPCRAGKSRSRTCSNIFSRSSGATAVRLLCYSTAESGTRAHSQCARPCGAPTAGHVRQNKERGRTILRRHRLLSTLSRFGSKWAVPTAPQLAQVQPAASHCVARRRP